MAAIDKPDVPAVQPPAKERAVETVTLAVGHPHDELVLHNIEDDKGKPLVITSAGAAVPADQEKAVRDAAKDADVTIRKVN